jgi:hypothetical protein
MGRLGVFVPETLSGHALVAALWREQMTAVADLRLTRDEELKELCLSFGVAYAHLGPLSEAEAVRRLTVGVRRFTVAVCADTDVAQKLPPLLGVHPPLRALTVIGLH